jgi:tetratricopeptide (TPR) repeat protein
LNDDHPRPHENVRELDTPDVESLLQSGRSSLQRFALEDAERAFRTVLQSDPANEAAFLSLMVILDRHRAGDLPDLARQAEQAGVGAAAIGLIEAHSFRRSKEHRRALAALAAVPRDYEPTIRLRIEGQLLDAVGEYDSAFEAYSRMNQLLSDDPAQPLRLAASARSGLARRLALTTAEWMASWAAPRLQPDGRSPVFLVGFPRSGTTLLDTMLMGHPDIQVLEERRALARLETEIGGLGGIAQLDTAGVRAAQGRYFEIVSEYADVGPGALLIDKAPLALNRAVLVHRLFPDARFILVLRHPADVILSCFMTAFALNPPMANFLRLDTAAEFYDLTFRTWENARSVLPLKVHAVRYERLIASPESELRGAIQAIDVPWHDAVMDHQRTAQARAAIATASYAQVIEPLYARANGRWRHYRAHLDPILPTLRPWIERYGYSI